VRKKDANDFKINYSVVIYVTYVFAKFVVD